MYSEYKKAGVIVLGGHIQALGIVRIFGRLKIPTVVIDSTPYNIAKHSKHCKKFYCIRTKDILTHIEEPYFTEKYKGWVIFPTNDMHVCLLSKNRDRLSKHYIVSTDSWETIEKFYNKKNTYRIAEKLGIPFPKTFYPQSEEDISNIKVEYPCILKPAVMHSFYSKVKKKVFLCNNAQELLNYYRIALSIIPSDEIIIQEIIKGPSKNQFSACFLFLQGKPYTSLTACRMRQHPLDFGNATTYAEVVDLPVIKEYAEQILGHTNYNGVCEVEFKLDDRDGLFKFLEVNTRTWKWHSISNKSNSPFLELFYNHLVGHKIVPHNETKKASFRHPLTDIPIQVKLLFKGYGYFCRMKKPIEYAVWDWNDLMPWIYEKIYLPFLILSR